MNRRSFFSVVAALPIVSLAAKALASEPSPKTPSEAVQRDVAWMRETAWREREGLPPPRRENFLRTPQEVREIFPIWSTRMTGLVRTLDAKTRCLGVQSGNTTWWIPLTIVKGNWPEVRDFGVWYNALPQG